jgi:Ni,Fe-hydrogenase I large subunit
MNVLKLRNLIEGIETKMEGNVHQEAAWSVEEKKMALEAIGKYNEYGGQLRREYNLMEIAHTLAKITEAAEKFTMTETEDWFDKKTVSENMKQLRRVSEEFNKLAKEAHTIQQRMEALYEDGGHVLSRYFEIRDLNEGAGPAVSKIKKPE